MTTTEPPAARNATAIRLARTPADMAKAVLVLLVPVLVAVAGYTYFFGGSNPIVIDPSGTYAEAQVSAHFTVLKPVGLPDGWRPISSSYNLASSSSVLRVGYVAPDGSGIQLVESDQPADSLIASELGGVRPVATSVQVGDRTWGQVNAAKRTDRALVDTESGRTVIIMGQANFDEMQAFAAALR